jgi:4a-hydroxytetrahydrobiopterin dehydratase
MALLSEYEIEHRLSVMDAWHLTRGGEIERELELADFATALAYVGRVGALAEEANHHPDILLHGWNKVRLTLSTHSDGGLTEADFSLAGKIDGLS